MMPSSGKVNVVKAASTKAGLAIHRISSASRGKSPPNIANKQPILITSCLVLHCQLHQGGGVQVAARAAPANGAVALRHFVPSIRFSFAPALHHASEHKLQHGGGSSPRDVYPLEDNPPR